MSKKKTKKNMLSTSVPEPIAEVPEPVVEEKEPIENKEQKDVVLDSVNVIIAKDMNEITDATSSAMKQVQAITYADNLKETPQPTATLTIEKEENIEQKIVKEPSISNIKTRKSHKKWYLLVGILLFLIALITVFCTIFAILHSNSNTILEGISINGIDVSNLTREEAKTKVSNLMEEKLSIALTLKHNDFETTIFPEQFDVAFDINTAVDTAYKIGRNGNILKNNFTILNALFSKTSVHSGLSYSEETLDTLIQEIEMNLPDRVTEPSHYIDGANLVITKGNDGIIIDTDNLKKQIIYTINNSSSDTSTIDIPVIQKTASAIDLESIHQEIYKEAQDAYYTTNPYVVYPHSDGLDFAISMEEATALLAEDKDSYVIPLQVLTPNVTTNQIGTEAFPDLLGSFSTTYSTSNYNRSTNIRLASEKINGVVIMPGETFSYNEVVGQRTAAAGFKSAAVYSNGQVTTGIGGGICQVSSTLYNAALYANLEIVERTNHGFNPGYVAAGRDATVSWGGPDFKFKNNRDYPIKIVCSGDSGKINFQIFGLKTDTEYEVEIQSYVTQTIYYKTVYKDDSSFAKGQTKVLESGSNGCKTETYKILKQNGTVISKTLLSKDTYNPHNRIIARGTK